VALGCARGTGLTRIGASPLATSLFRSLDTLPVKTLSAFGQGNRVKEGRRNALAFVRPISLPRVPA
jgi:hypothetical protein